MATVLIWCSAALALIALLAFIVWLLHRLCIRLEKAGYLYYREASKGGAGGVIYELDRLTRPSIEHVIEVQDPVVMEDEIDGE